MKFANVKTGDTLYYQKSISYGWRSDKFFFVPTLVGKLTKTGFYCTNGKFYLKEDGRARPYNFRERVYFLGDDFRNGEKVTDESDSAAEFEYCLKASAKIRSLAEKLDGTKISSMQIPYLKAAIKALEFLKVEVLK